MHSRKIKFYAKNIILDLIPKVIWKIWYTKNIAYLNDTQISEFLDKVSYYCKIDNQFECLSDSYTLKTLSVFKHPSGPCYDLRRYLGFFDSKLNFHCDLTDQDRPPVNPSFVKCRPISNENTNYVLLKLNSSRFYDFQADEKQFAEKRNHAIFRGPCHKPHRQKFIQNCYGLPNTNIGDTRPTVKKEFFYRPHTSRQAQLKNKFIISVEGNDVASNLPWIMASNSLAFLRKPKFEGWFMQGKLIPNYHYVLLKDDYSDLEEKIDYYSSNELDALEIINNAHKHVAQFFDHKSELITSLLVLEKYFKLSNQI